MSPVVLAFVLIASRFGADAMTFVTKEEEKGVAVGADAKQQLLRNVHREAEIMRSEKRDVPTPPTEALFSTQEFPDIHGDAQNPWTWTKDGKGGWKRSSVTPEQAQQAKEVVDKASQVADEAVGLAKSVNINLYYETRCPDCVMFINQTLRPLWNNKEIRPHLNITMNPYGNAMSIPVSKVSEGYKFWHPNTTSNGWAFVHICQHGTDECLGNLIQACAISMSTSEQFMEMVFCMADKPDWSIEKSSYECMNQTKIDQKAVKECVNTPQGNKMFADLGRLTQAVPGRQGTPWVLIEGTNLANTTDLMRSVCGHVGNGPSSCAPFKNAAPATPTPVAHHAASDDFTVLPVLEKKEKNLVALSSDQI